MILLHPSIPHARTWLRAFIFALLVLLVLVGTLSAAPRRQVVVDICNRTPKVRDWILEKVQVDTPATTCSNATDAQLTAITGELAVNAYINAELLEADFAGLTGITQIAIRSSPALKRVPADAFDGLSRTQITRTHSGIEEIEPRAFSRFTGLEQLWLSNNSLQGVDRLP